MTIHWLCLCPTCFVHRKTLSPTQLDWQLGPSVLLLQQLDATDTSTLRDSQLWNAFPIPFIPDNYKLQKFKCRIVLILLFLKPIPFLSFYQSSNSHFYLSLTASVTYLILVEFSLCLWWNDLKNCLLRKYRIL